MVQKILNNLRPDLQAETKRFLDTLSDMELKGISALSENVQPLEIEKLMIVRYLKGEITPEDFPGREFLNGFMFDIVKEKFNNSR